MKYLFTILFLSIWLCLSCETIAKQPSNYYEETAGTLENPYLINILANLRWLSEARTVWGNETEKYYFLQKNILGIGFPNSTSEGFYRNAFPNFFPK